MSSSLSCGILGLPNVGKSTLFNALTSQVAAASNYPFCTIEPNLGLVEIPDNRLEHLAKLSKSRQITAANMRFWDIAGLVEGASRGEGLGNQFLNHIRQVDALVHVVRCFENEEIIHVADRVDPARDAELINTELILSDLQVVQNAEAKLHKQAKGGKAPAGTLAVLEKLRAQLDQGLLARAISFDEDESPIVQGLNLLTTKPVLYVANIAEQDLANPEKNPFVRKLIQHLGEQSSVLPICADLEAQIAGLELLERPEMLAAAGLASSGLDRLILASFAMLKLITFLTTGEQETRAWPIPEGTSAQRAAGRIHSDLERGFIRAEVIAYGDYIQSGSRQRARELGKLRAESRDYRVCDGDVILFLHN